MPIEFAPPPVGNLQGFQIPGPQQADPLQTLAQMQQLKTQRLQQQSAGLGLQQAQLKMASQQALIKAFVDAGKEDGQPPAAGAQAAPGAQAGDFTPIAGYTPAKPPALTGVSPALTGQPAQAQTPTTFLDRVYRNAVRSGVVLPEDLTQLQEHRIKLLTDTATLDEKQRAALDKDINTVRGSYQGVTDQASLDRANQDLQRRGAFRSGKLTPLTQFTDVDHVQAYGAGLIGYSEVLAEAKAKAEREKEEAQTEQAKAGTTETKQKIDAGEYQATLRDIQGAEKDQNGVPTPRAWAAIRQAHPKVTLPDTPTTGRINELVRAAVPPEKLPEYDIAQYKKDMGLVGNTEYDQYMAQYAKSLGKKANALNFDETRRGTQLYAKDKMDPTLYALAVGQKGLQESLLRSQKENLPTDEDIQYYGRAMATGEATLDQIKELGTRGGNFTPRAVRAAEEYVQKNGNPLFPGKPFSLANLKAALDTREKTETKFSTGPEAQMARSFDNLMQHTDLLDKARLALKNSDIPALNTIANAFGIQAGSTAETTYDLIAGFVADESAKAFIAGGGGEGERASKLANFARDKGDQQISDNIKALMHLADSQRQGLENQYARGTFGKGLQTGKLFSPEALAARDRLMGKKTAPAAGGHTIRIGNKLYHYNGTGDTKDLKNYTELKTQ